VTPAWLNDVWEVPDETIRPALWFYDHGIAVFPLRASSKDPACRSWDDYTCSRKEAARMRQHGVPLSASRGVLDTDNRADELWVLQQIADGGIPETPFVVETARGFHRYYRLVGPMPKFIRRNGHVLEFRNQGQYVVGPGSVHPSGVTYTARPWSWRWEDIPFFPADFVFDDGTCPPASSVATGGPFRLAAVITEKERHDTLHRLMRTLVAHGVPLDGALAVCHAENQSRCRPPLRDLHELDRFLRRAYHQKDRGNFTRSPKTGWDLAGSLLEIGLSVERVLDAVRSIDPTFDPESTPLTSERAADREASE
jgi:hypothetical protein